MILDTIKKLLEEQLDIDPETISPETDIAEDLGADSLDMVELLMSLEEEFDLTIADTDAKNFKTIGDVMSYIEARG